MGVTPLEGIMMGTRCGSVDPAIIPYLMRKGEITTADEIDKMMNKKSGMLGVSQKTSDNQEICKMADAGDERAQLVVNMYSHQIAKNVGAYMLAMGGTDAIVFTGGIGENDALARANVCSTLGYLGVDFNNEINDKIHGDEAILTNPGSKVTVAVVPTNEELVIATDTMNLVK